MYYNLLFSKVKVSIGIVVGIVYKSALLVLLSCRVG